MSHSNEESPQALIARFVLECKGKGTFLPYSDHAIVDEWLKHASSLDELLLVLSDILPDYFEGDKGAKKQLTGVRKLVLSCLKDRAMR